MKNIRLKLDEIREHGYGMDFSDTFDHALNVYKNIVLMSGLATLVFSIVMIVLLFGITTAIAMFVGITGTFGQVDPESWTVMGVLIYIVSAALVWALASPFFGGLMKMCQKADRREYVSFSDAFMCFRPPYFVPLFGQALLISVLSVSITAVFQLYAGNYVLVGTFLNFAISLFTMMSIPLIVFENLKPVEAITASAMIVSKNLGVTILLVICSGILAMLGFIAICVGIFFTIPFVFAMNFALYKNAVGVDDGSEIDEIGISDAF